MARLTVTINAKGAKSGAAEFNSAIVGMTNAAKQFEARVKGMENAAATVMNASTKATSRLSSHMDAAAKSANLLKGAMIALAGSQAASSIIGTIAGYEGLRASLITATKSASGAETAFKDLQSFADKTPYTLEQATKAYIRMSSAGLKPSIAALNDFGDIASAIPGKDILDFVEAVADGTQGQGRRLKEFGIDLDVMGDQVRLKYGNMTQVVANDSATIETALRKIATTNFGGSMERQSKTLAGQWSTLQDKAAGLADEIGQGGLLSAMKDVVVELTDGTNGSKAMAREIGAALGDGVRATAAAVRFLVTHTTELKSLFAGIIAYKTATTFIGIATAMQGATAAAGGFRVAMVALGASNPLGWVLIAAAGMAEIVQNWDYLSSIGKGKTPGGIEYSAISSMGSDMGMGDTTDVAYEAAYNAGAAWAQKKEAQQWVGGLFKQGGKAIDDALFKDDRDAALYDQISSMYAKGGAGGAEQRDKAKNPKAPGSGGAFKAALKQDEVALGEHLDATIAAYYEAQQKISASRVAQEESFQAYQLSKLQQATAWSPESYAIEQKGMAAVAAAQAKFGEQAKQESPVQQMINQYTELKSVTLEWQNLAVGAADSFASTLADALTGGKVDWKEFAQQMRKDITELLIKMLVMEAIKAALSGITGGGSTTVLAGIKGLAGRVFHEGGTVGEGGASRSLPAATWAGAPRYHSGTLSLRPDEVPAILQTGEQVLSRSQVAQGRNSGGSKPALHFHFPDVRDGRGAARSLNQNAGRFRDLLRGDE